MGTTQPRGDNLLLHDMQQGSKSAFNRIFRKYYPLLCAYSNRFVCLEDAEEIVQDVMLWLWENREELAVESSLNAYLLKTVYHRSINRITKNQAQQRADIFYYLKIQKSYIELDDYRIVELINQIKGAVKSLPQSYSESFTMHRFLGMSYKEIAEKLNVSTKTVDYRIQQALKLLRIALVDYLPIIILIQSI